MCNGAKLAYLFVVILIAGCFIVLYKHLFKVKPKGGVILLHGTSSAGKSALLQEFQKLNDQVVIFKIDDWFPGALTDKAKELGWTEDADMHPWLYLHQYMTQKTGKVFFDTELRDALFNDALSFYVPVMSAVQDGKMAMVDTVLESDMWHKEFDDYFASVPTFKVLVYCPLDEIIKRVAERNKKGGAEKRTTFQSFEQFSALYGMQDRSKQIVDTVSSHVLLKALYDAIDELIVEGVPSVYVPKLELFKQRFIEHYGLRGEDHPIELVALHHYDLILNSGIYDAPMLAQQLQQFLVEF